MIMKHLKIKIMSIAFMAVATSSMAQSLNKMNWLNEPQQWEIKDSKTLVMDVPAKQTFGGFLIMDSQWTTDLSIMRLMVENLKPK